MTSGSRRAARALFAALALLATGTVQAQSQAHSLRFPYHLVFDNYSLLPGDGPTGVEREVGIGEVLMTTRLGYATAARAAEPMSLTLAGMPIAIPAGAVLLLARANGGAISSLPQGSRIFCAPPMHLPETRDQDRLSEVVQPCFVDTNGDDRFDLAFLSGTRRGEDRRMLRYAAPYTLERDLPLPNSPVRMSYQESGMLRGPMLSLDIVFMGRPLDLATIRANVDGRMRTVLIGHHVRQNVYPHSFRFAAAQLTVLGYDPGTRRIRVRVDHDFESTPIEFDIAVHGLYSGDNARQ
jgi:hypothetical protein